MENEKYIEAIEDYMFNKQSFWQVGKAVTFDPFDSIVRQFTRELIDHKMIKPFRELKKMDRIEITENNYTAIVNANLLNTALYMYRPFINKGVMIITQSNETDVYINFNVIKTDFEAGIIELFMDIYTFERGVYSKLVDFTCELSEENDNIKCHFKDIKYNFEYYVDLINKNLIHLTNEDYAFYKKRLRIFLETMQEDYKNHDTIHSWIMGAFLRCFVYLNNCIDIQKMEDKNKIPRSYTKRKAEVIIQESKNNTIKDKVIIINGIKIKKGENSEIRTHQGKLIRHTQVWGVTGHFRHYKSGKTVYIEPYKKGPARKKAEPGKTIFKVRTPEITDIKGDG